MFTLIKGNPGVPHPLEGAQPGCTDQATGFFGVTSGSRHQGMFGTSLTPSKLVASALAACRSRPGRVHRLRSSGAGNWALAEALAVCGMVRPAGRRGDGAGCQAGSVAVTAGAHRPGDVRRRK